MNESVASYERAPSDELQSLILEKFLSPLLEIRGRSVSGCKLDIHFRPKDTIHIYCGHARLLEVIRQKTEGSAVKVDANFVYKDQSCAKRLFGHWQGGESDFKDALDRYLDEVKIDTSYTEKEGAVQDRWSRVKTDPWTPFDREAALEYSSDKERFQIAYFVEVDNARNILYKPLMHMAPVARVCHQMLRLRLGRGNG